MFLSMLGLLFLPGFFFPWLNVWTDVGNQMVDGILKRQTVTDMKCDLVCCTVSLTHRDSAGISPNTRKFPAACQPPAEQNPED